MDEIQAAIREFGDEYENLLGQYASNVERKYGLILRGHLIIDHALNNILQTVSSSPRYLEGARLSFLQKINIIRALANFDVPLEDQFWASLVALNAIRNKMAHTLSERDLSSLMGMFLVEYTGWTTSEEHEEAIWKNLGFILGVLAGVKARAVVLRPSNPFAQPLSQR